MAADTGAFSVPQARKQYRVAHERAVRAAKRESRARYVLSATRTYVRLYGPRVGRWTRLALDVGWPRAELGTLFRVIAAESGGDPFAVNASSRCAGLLQLHPCWYSGSFFFNPYDARENLRIGLWLRRNAGWQSWVTY